MKKVLLLLLGIASCLMAEVSWRDHFFQAQKEAKAAQKPMIVLLVSHTCRWCRRLENRTLHNPRIEALIARHFIPVRLYREADDYPDTIHSSMVPTTFYLTPEGKNIIKPVVGYWEHREYESDMRLALKRYKSSKRAP